jgi:hypothetical protein
MPADEAGTAQYADFLNFHTLACSSLFLYRPQWMKRRGIRVIGMGTDPVIRPYNSRLRAIACGDCARVKFTIHPLCASAGKC